MATCRFDITELLAYLLGHWGQVVVHDDREHLLGVDRGDVSSPSAR
ncbi:MAG: hypothetical protein ACXVRK_09500 [Gaiellaceae bacterium]